MDFLEEGLSDASLRPDDPDDLPNPKNPGGISNNAYRALLANQKRAEQTPSDIAYGTPKSAGGTATTWTSTTAGDNFIGAVSDTGQTVGDPVLLDAMGRQWDSDYAKAQAEVDKWAAAVAQRPDSKDRQFMYQRAKDNLAALGQRPGGPNKETAGINGATGSQPGVTNPNGSASDTLSALEAGAGIGTGTNAGSPAGSSNVPGEAPKVNRDAINDVLGSTQSIQSYILGLAGQGRDYSLAEAQLRQATEQATAHALGQARAGNRRDRGLLERQAVAEGAYNQQQAGRDTALLRAQEEDQNRRFQLDTAAKAAELGLDVASAMTNIEQIDVASANNYLNNQFQQLGIDKQISEDRMKEILGFTRDMAMIQFNYDQLSVDDQNEADKLLMQKYGIDQQTMVQLKQIKEQGKFKWSDLLANMAGGLVGGVTGALGRKYI